MKEPKASQPPFKIGKRYWVWCIRTSRRAGYGCAHMPINGPWHEDAAIIRFPDEHYHVDWRFVARLQWERCIRYYWHSSDLGRVQTKVLTAWAIAPGINGNPAVPVLRLRMCHRDAPDFPGIGPWMKELEAKFKDHRLPDKCFTCPHRGIDLRSGNVRADGTVVCPGHGLKWNLKTRRLVPRENKPHRIIL